MPTLFGIVGWHHDVEEGAILQGDELVDVPFAGAQHVGRGYWAHHAILAWSPEPGSLRQLASEVVGHRARVVGSDLHLAVEQPSEDVHVGMVV
eukprot:CAMPEP_0206472524 /NCGR_PEP_ID=MMETSP0324_2-20121206/32254_1 /ASSEMBLY_ACC=CAM_ASM_000836 /TAXON_ID=2866 /ORGANISM="Crypthecodinium cohnii, Strain Seligo" /LENGTH=92 /DNA_ID=CAMNT_0053947145 /DNA_START=510 /DNA_END=788 /DNA_ORIENTATION=+